MDVTNNIETAVRGFIVEEFLDEDIDLENSTELVTTGIVDSISVLRMVDFLEEEYDVEFEPNDITNFTNISNIARIVAERAAA